MTDGAFNPVLYPITKAWGFTTKQYRVPSDSEIAELLQLTNYNDVEIKGNSVYLKPGMMFDLGGIGKGWAGDEAIKILRQNGVKSAILDLGGNVQTIGSKPDGTAWQVGLQNPWGDGAVAAIKIKNEAMITSGGYVRYFTGDDGKKYVHIMDGITGRPVENDVVSTTIITEFGTYADGLSTATYVLGKNRSIDLWKNNKNFEMILLTPDKSISYTKGLEGKIELLYDFTSVEVIK
jgi:thiamine biosynthesis lipoprotein